MLRCRPFSHFISISQSHVVLSPTPLSLFRVVKSRERESESSILGDFFLLLLLPFQMLGKVFCQTFVQHVLCQTMPILFVIVFRVCQRYSFPEPGSENVSLGDCVVETETFLCFSCRKTFCYRRKEIF